MRAATILLIMVTAVLADPRVDAKPSARPEMEYEFHSWGGSQRHRGGELDTGIGVVACVTRRLRAGAQLAPNKVGVCAGFRAVGINLIKDTRIGGLKDGWEPGVYIAMSF